jgi:uncharacterized membrane protein YhaH (DUF805 family)
MGGNFTNYPTLNGSELIDLFRHGNSVTGGYFWIVILAMTYFVLFVTLMRIRPLRDSFAVTSWITGIFAMLLWALQLIGGNIMMVFALLMIVGLIAIWMRGENEY